MKGHPKGMPAKDHQREAVKRLADELGEDGAAKDLGVSRSTVGRIIAGRGLYFTMRELLNSRFGAEAS
jgi:hypothetical protein